jgi:hypothetical protein
VWLKIWRIGTTDSGIGIEGMGIDARTEVSDGTDEKQVSYQVAGV